MSKLIFLAGIDDAGKSKTIRNAIKYLGVNNKIVQKFLKQINPPKHFKINKTPISVYITSPQEVTGGEIAESVERMCERLSGNNEDSIFIMTLNLESKYKQSIEACLKELNMKGLKDSTFFIFLNADLKKMMKENEQAKIMVGELIRKGYNFIGEIHRTNKTTEEQQGWKFAFLINQNFLKSLDNI